MSEPKLMACPLDGCEMRWKETHVNHWKIECSQCSLEYGSGSGTDRNWIATSWNTRNTRHTRHSATEGQFTTDVPTEQGWYWHWNGDVDCAPCPISVMYSGTSGKCFVSSGQLGITSAIDCDKYGGYWLRMQTPTVKQSFTVQEGE